VLNNESLGIDGTGLRGFEKNLRKKFLTEGGSEGTDSRAFDLITQRSNLRVDFHKQLLFNQLREISAARNLPETAEYLISI
jgi:hypothetical protein